MYYHKISKKISQGDIFKNFSKEEYTLEGDELTEIITEFPYVVVITQDCDLEQDFSSRAENKPSRHYIPSILVCPIYLADSLKKGVHLKELGYEFQDLGSKLWNPIKKNNDCRYHFLEGYEIEDPKIIVPDLVIDFKHYFTVSREKMYKNLNSYFVSSKPLFREQLSQRFAYYLNRIGLPNVSIDNPLNSCYDCSNDD